MSGGQTSLDKDMYIPSPEESAVTTTERSTTLNKAPNVAPLPLQHHHLNLRMIGNCAFNALIDEKGCVVWSCMPRFDADPVFCSSLRKNKDIGFFDIELQHFARSEQEYVKNTAILKTTLYDKMGNSLEIIDFCPFFFHLGRAYRPTVLVRMLKATGRPRIRVRLRPTFGYGWGVPEKTRGSNHIRYLVPTGTLRLTSNAPIAYLQREVCFEVDHPIYLILMPDESLTTTIDEFALSSLEKTQSHWQGWVSYLAIPFEWQEAVIRSCITMKLMMYQETGAIISSATTSIPPMPLLHPTHTSDERYCRVQDMPFMVRTLNRLGMGNTMGQFLEFISNLVVEHTDSQEAEGGSGNLQSVYGIGLETLLHEKPVHRLSGYRGQGPVLIGNRDYAEIATDAYGCVILAMAQAFFDLRLTTPGDQVLFYRLERLGQEIMEVYKQPSHVYLDKIKAGPKVHIYPVVMCWAGLDRLGKIARQLGITDRETFWQNAAEEVREYITNTFYDSKRKIYTSEKDGGLSAHVLLLPEVGFIAADDPTFANTVNEIESQLMIKEHPFLLSHPNQDPAAHCYTLFTIWYINALYGLHRMDEARKLFEEVLSCCNGCGTVSETIDPRTKELWGNFPHTLTTTTMIYTALRLSIPWRNMV